VVTGVEYFGHDQVATVRLHSGALLRVRLLARSPVASGQQVAVMVHGPVAVFPVDA
jgi:hypothetical protein